MARMKLGPVQCSGPCGRKLSAGRILVCRACRAGVCRPCVLHHRCSTGRVIVFVKLSEVIKKIMKELEDGPIRSDGGESPEDGTESGEV